MSGLELLVLYLAFRAKQVICDYFLQTQWMAVSKGAPWLQGGARALGLHAGIHGAFTFIVVVLFAPSLWWLGIVDVIVHGAIDRTGMMIKQKNNWTYQDTRYWWAMGLDQEAHNVTHLLYILAIVWAHGGLCAVV